MHGHRDSKTGGAETNANEVIFIVERCCSQVGRASSLVLTVCLVAIDTVGAVAVGLNGVAIAIDIAIVVTVDAGAVGGGFGAVCAGAVAVGEGLRGTSIVTDSAACMVQQDAASTAIAGDEDFLDVGRHSNVFEDIWVFFLLPICRMENRCDGPLVKWWTSRVQV